MKAVCEINKYTKTDERKKDNLKTLKLIIKLESAYNEYIRKVNKYKDLS